MKQTAVPFSLVISPMARTVDQEYPPPIVNFGDLGPVRCIRCKAYMCPYMQFIDSGRRFQCLFCKATTDGTLHLRLWTAQLLKREQLLNATNSLLQFQLSTSSIQTIPGSDWTATSVQSWYQGLTSSWRLLNTAVITPYQNPRRLFSLLTFRTITSSRVQFICCAQGSRTSFRTCLSIKDKRRAI